jgi:hypothetical protein
MSNFSSKSWREQVPFQWDDDVYFVLNQHTWLDCHSIRWLKQQSAGRHVTWHIILMKSTKYQFDSPWFGQTESLNSQSTYCTWGKQANHYTTDAWFGQTESLNSQSTYCTWGKQANHYTTDAWFGQTESLNSQSTYCTWGKQANHYTTDATFLLIESTINCN